MFSKSVNLFFKNPIIGLPSLLLALITSLFARFIIGTNYLKNFDSNSISGLNTIPAGLARAVSFFLLYAIIVMLIEPLIQAITILLAKNALDRSEESFQNIVRYSLKYYWRLLGVLVFKLFLLVGIFIGTIIIIMPSLTKFSVSPHSFPYGSLLLIFLMALLIIVFSILMLPIEPILVYEDLSLGDSISKGIQFGFKRLPALIGVTLLVGIGTTILNYVLSLIIGDVSEISSSITSYFSVCVTIYILCSYKETIDRANLQVNFKETLQDDLHNDGFLGENFSTDQLQNTKPIEDSQSDKNAAKNENIITNTNASNKAATITDSNLNQSINENLEIVEQKKNDSNKFIV